MGRETSERELSRLEMAVLGLISKGSPCTAYWIRRQFQISPSSYFSGSAGAVYPAVKRLRERALVEATPRREGNRKSVEYRLTAVGKRTLRTWLLPPLPARDVAFTLDPVRMRVYYLDALTPEDRVLFVDEALAKARRQALLKRAESEELESSGAFFDYLGSLGVLYEVRARVRWLEAVRRALTEREEEKER